MKFNALEEQEKTLKLNEFTWENTLKIDLSLKDMVKTKKNALTIDIMRNSTIS